MPYPHEPLIRAWLDGRAVQYLEDGTWRDMDGPDRADKLPHFYRDSTAYRLKPIPVRVRNALMGDRGKHWIVAVNTVMEETMTGKHENFIRWVDDWREFEA